MLDFNEAHEIAARYALDAPLEIGAPFGSAFLAYLDKMAELGHRFTPRYPTPEIYAAFGAVNASVSEPDRMEWSGDFGQFAASWARAWDAAAQKNAPGDLVQEGQAPPEPCGDAGCPPEQLDVEQRLAALEHDSHPPVDFGHLLENIYQRLEALEQGDA